MADPPGFLQRWSRLKQADREASARRGALAPPDAPGSQQPVAEPEAPIDDLPALESLTKDSDFRPFMRAGVPEELRNQALRKLWSSDPVYANLDGLLEYGEDFGEPFRVAGVVATVYRVLEGMPDAEPAREPPTPAEPVGKAPTAGPEVPACGVSEPTPNGDPASFETAVPQPPQDDASL